ncbi:MAG: hypothetical protein AB1656_19890 [Candidatus Omnitrophota bacterium]
MMNPLDEHIKTFQFTMAAIKVARRALDRRLDPLSNTDLYSLPPQEGREMLDQAEENLCKLMVFALFATFERTLRDHLSESLESLSTSATTPAELAAKLHEFLRNGIDNWRVNDIIELFYPPAAEQDINNAKNIRTFRNHVAHGSTPPSSIPPETAHAQLSNFLKSASLAV